MSGQGAAGARPKLLAGAAAAPRLAGPAAAGLAGRFVLAQLAAVDAVPIFARDLARGPWTVPAQVLRIVDADTIRLRLDQGWYTYREENCRVIGVDAPERFTDAGRAASAWAAEQLPAGARVTFISRQLDKYGRPLGDVLFGSPVDSYAAALMAAGHAVAYAG